jgi:hypothetical protein
MSYFRMTMSFLAIPIAVFVLLFVGWLLAAGCSRAHIFVANQSGSSISNLVISGSCKERRTNTLAPLSEWRTVTPYHSGGQIQFSFVSAGRSYIISPDKCTNLSGFCGISFMVASNMMVTSGVRK